MHSVFSLRGILAAAVFAAVLASVGRPALAQSATATVTGTVQSTAGTPVPGVAITLNGPAKAATTTDAAGSFTLSVPPGIYSVTATKPGYVSASTTDVSVAAGSSQPLSITVSEQSLTSLRQIGSVTAGRAGVSTINTGAATQSFVGAQSFKNLANPQIMDVLQHLPDVVIQKLGSQQDQTIVVGGLQPYETQVLMDGHPIALGQYGVWFAQYFPSFLIGGIETQSGPGNTTPFANIAVAGTANILTPAFTTKPTGEFTIGTDNYGSQYSNALATGSTGKLSYVAALGVGGNNGYYFKKNECDVYTPAPSPAVAIPGNPPPAPGANQPGNVGVVAYCADFSGSLFTKGQLLKLKYDFSPTTSFEAGMIGSYGQYSPQGSAWGNSLGPTTVVECLPGASVIRTSPSTQGLVGQTINGFFWYPGTQLTNSQQLWNAQIRTSIGDNTLLIRPYIGSIQPETYDGEFEGQYAAYYGQLPGQPGYQAPTLGNGVAIPPAITNFAANNPFTPNPALNNFENQCGVATSVSSYQIQSPQNTIVTAPNGQEECFQYPYSSYELDTLYGSTISFIHPFGDSFLDFTYDFHGQDTYAFANSPANLILPHSGTRFSTFSLTGGLNMIKNLAINFGLYDTNWSANGVNADANGNLTIPLQRNNAQIDPHIAFVFRPQSDTSYRVSYGNSVTFPFVGDLSGPAAFQPPASGFTGGILTFKVPTLLPETSIAYAAGVDHRFGNGSIATLDLQDIVVHNTFQQLISVLPGTDLGTFTPYNTPLFQTKLATFKYAYAPRVGLGYNVALTADSSIMSGVPASVMSSYPFLPANNVQVCSDGLFTPGIATCIPYLKGYGQVTFTSKNGLYTGLGLDFEGKNNAYYQPPFAFFDLTMRKALRSNLDAQFSVQNLFNQDSYQYLAAPNLGVPITSNYTLDGKTVQQGSYPTYLIPAPTRTLRFQVRYHAGR